MRAQEEESGKSMALSEPLGGGLFVSNVVLAFVILLGSQHQTVSRLPHPKRVPLAWRLAMATTPLSFEVFIASLIFD